MAKVKIGFVGVGGMGQAAHLRNYIATPDAEVVAIAEIRPRLGQKVAARYGIPKVYNGHKELIDNEPLDAIVAIQPFGMHVDIVPELLTKKVPIMTEKPLADRYEHGVKIVNAVNQSGGKLFQAYHKRCDPATGYALKQIAQWRESKEVGAMKYIRVAMPPGDWVANGFSQNVGTDEGYAAVHGMGGKYGDFVNYYIHQVNLIRLLLGEDYRVTYADPGRVLLAGVSQSGVTVALEMQAYSSTIDWHESALIAFERGYIQLDLPAPVAINRPGKVTVFSDPGKGKTPTTTVPTLPWVHAMWQQAMNFVAAVRGEKTVLCEANESLKDLQLARDYIDLLEKAQTEK